MWSRYAPYLLAVVVVVCLGIGLAVQPGLALQADGHDEGSHEGTPTESGAGGHGGGHGEESGSPSGLHLFVEVIQIVLAVGAIASVVLAGRLYGGEIGRALYVSGVGVTALALQRLWHNFHELNVLGAPPTLGSQGLFILATGALAAGYVSLYRTMSSRTA